MTVSLLPMPPTERFGDPNSVTDTANTMMDMAKSYITALGQAASSVFPPTITPYFPGVGGAAPTLISALKPSLIDVTWAVPPQPAAFSGTLDISKYMPAAFTGVAPTLNFGTQPAQFTGTIPAAPVTSLDFTYPTVSVSLPSLPSLMSLSTVMFNPLDIPTFTGQEPTLTLAAPSVAAYEEPLFYTSATLQEIEASLQRSLTDGTDTGLDNDTLQAMWDAAREREYRQQADALAELDRMETLGYAFPPGVFINSRIKIQTETNYTIAGLSRDITVTNAKLRLENVTKARETAVLLEGKLIDYYNQVAQRGFDAAKYYTEAHVQIYNAQVQAFGEQIKGYEASIQAFDIEMKRVQVYVDQLKAQIAFEQTKAEINTALVNQYKVEMDGALAQLEVYKTQVQIIQTEAEVEKLKVETYSAQIQAFTGTVNAYTAQVEGYKANVEAQAAIESAFKTQVDAYATQVQAGVAYSNALVAQYDGQVKAYEAQLDGYKATLQAMVEQVHAAAEYNTAEVEVYKGEVQANAAYNEALVKEWEAVINEQLQISQVAVKAAEANGQLYIAARQLSIDASKTGAQVAAQLGAAALNAISFHNSASWSMSGSNSNSTSQSDSTSDDKIQTV